MRYMGGKHRIAKRIAPIVLSYGKRVADPFCGAMNVTLALLDGGADFVARCDADPDVIAMWRECAYGEWVPPSSVTEQEYKAARQCSEAPLRGFVAHQCSFFGKKWAGYARGGNHNFAAAGRRSFLSMRDRFRRHTGKYSIECASYDCVDMSGADVVYCDPPYVGTTSTWKFDSHAFGAWVGTAVVPVLISERAPYPGWVHVAEFGPGERLYLARDSLPMRGRRS